MIPPNPCEKASQNFTRLVKREFLTSNRQDLFPKNGPAITDSLLNLYPIDLNGILKDSLYSATKALSAGDPPRNDHDLALQDFFPQQLVDAEEGAFPDLGGDNIPWPLDELFIAQPLTVNPGDIFGPPETIGFDEPTLSPVLRGLPPVVPEHRRLFPRT